MSRVTGVMILCSLMDEDADGPIGEIKAWLAATDYGEAYSLNQIDDHAGGHKHPQFAAFAGGFNFFDTHAAPAGDGRQGSEIFAEFVMTREWCYPENVVLIIQPEDGETKVWRPARYATLSVVAEPDPPPKMKAVGPPPEFPESWGKVRT
jgi:hypothetical protein